MSLLTIVNRAQSVLNLPISSTVYSSTGQTQKQLLQLANIEGVETADEYAWQALTTEKTFTTTATEEQTDSTADLPTDLGWIVDETLYNRTATWKVLGPIASRLWQEQKAFGITSGMYSQFRIRGNSFWFIPAPAAGQSVYYEYVSNKWCQATGGGTTRAAWGADTDVGLIDEHVMTLGLIWRWKASKGLDFTQDYNTWEATRGRKAARDGSKRKLSAAGPSAHFQIGAGKIQEGSWT